MQRRTLNSSALAWLAGTANQASSQTPSAAASQPRPPPRHYAVMSLLGDALRVVTYRPQVGSHLDRNQLTLIPMPAGLFDHAVLRAVDRGIQTSVSPPSAAPVFLGASSQLTESAPDKLFDGARLVLPESALAAIQGTAATHLILVTRTRAPANLQALRTHVGSGFLEGPGFYIDHVLKMTDSETNETGKGFLAPFLYLKLSLIEMATLTTLSSQTITATGTFSVARNRESFDPWQALSPAEKLTVMQKMIATEVKRVMPALLAGR